MLQTPRVVYKPFEYPEAHRTYLLAVQSRWDWNEVKMNDDIDDFNFKLTPIERHIITTVLRIFTQLEIGVQEYWSHKVMKWFPKPEIQQMASTFGSFEAIHISAYSHLSETLGLPESEYSQFLLDPSMKAKIDRIGEMLERDSSDEEIAISLAIFSAFTEGVSLFSNFAILLNFGRFDKLKGISQIIRWSSRDESLHSNAGCWLFRTFVSEKPHVLTDDLKKAVYQAARDTIELEDDYIDRVFALGNMEGLTARQLKAYVRHRANTKLGDLGLKSNWKNLDKEALSEITSWLDPLLSATEHTDFFAQRSTAYAKGNIDWSKSWDGYVAKRA